MSTVSRFMKEHNVWLVDQGTDPIWGAVVNEGKPVVVGPIHPVEKCAGRPCVVHAPSEHHMRDWPIVWRSDKGIAERTCSHGVGHPDPDDAAFHVAAGRDYLTVHGCDGCCQPEQEDDE